jgi:hypothetical protein
LSAHDPLRISRTSAIAGFALWIALGLRLDLIPWLMLLGPLVAVPLGLALVEPEPGTRSSRVLALARRLQPIAATMGAAAFLIDGAPIALALALAWVGLTALVALGGLLRATERRALPLVELSIDAGLLYLPVGAAWMTASRMRWTVLGFSGDMVTLTGAHFHFAGFAAPILVGLTGRAVMKHGGPKAERLASIAAGGAILGPPLVAAGITLSRALELPGAAILASCLLTAATLNVLVVRKTIASPAARGLLNVSSMSLVLTMALAVTYASLRVLHREDALPIRWMARWHGVGNAVGFALCGLVGWTVARSRRGSAA